jgi:RNA polymerase-binding protein DksA
MTSSLDRDQLRQLNQDLRERLLQLQKEIHQELLQSDNEQYIELAGQVHDTAEESVADLLADVNLAIVDRHIHEIRDIEEALMRVGDETYGICTDCDGDIAYERLQAYPTAKRCRDCQEVHERRSLESPHSM